MPVITLHQLQKRTKHELISDEAACCMDPIMGPTTVRRAERTREARYPIHRRLRRAAIRYFLDEGWDVVPHGIGVWGARKAMADLAIAKERRIVFVECLTQGWVYYQNAQSKRRLEAFFRLWFVIEDPAIAGGTSYRHRAERLARKSRVFIWSYGRGLTRRSTRTRKARASARPFVRRLAAFH